MNNTENNVERENTALLVYESAMARMEREHDKERKTMKHFVVFLCVLLFLAVSGLIGMFVYESQWIDEVTVAEADAADGGDAIANVSGEVNYYGESES